MGLGLEEDSLYLPGACGLVLGPFGSGWYYKSLRSCGNRTKKFKIMRTVTLTKEVKPGLPVDGKWGWVGMQIKTGRNASHHVLLLQGL